MLFRLIQFNLNIHKESGKFKRKKTTSMVFMAEIVGYYYFINFRVQCFKREIKALFNDFHTISSSESDQNIL